MDLVGIAMGIVTIPMALLTAAGVLGGVALVAAGDWPALGWGVLGLGLALGVAIAMERIVLAIDAAAVVVARRRGRARGLWVGAIGAVMPMAVILAWEWHVLTWLWSGGLARGLWTYLVAAGPWTIFAARDGGNRRTLSAIRAYAAHVSLWLLIVLREWFGLDEAALVAMALPALLPIAVGTLLAVADRDALRNVRI